MLPSSSLCFTVINSMASLLRLSLTSCLTRRVTSACVLAVQRPPVQHKLLKRSLHHHGACTRLPSMNVKDSCKKQSSSTLFFPQCNILLRNNFLPIHLSGRTMSSFLSQPHASLLLIRDPVLRSRVPCVTYLFSPLQRFYSKKPPKDEGFTLGQKNKSIMLYMVALFIFAIGVTYAAVPLYSVFCQVSWVL